jgi:FkbM family methyltransferase
MNAKANPDDFWGRWREIISDPLNLLIHRDPFSGLVDKDGNVYLHNSIKVPSSGANSYYEDFSKVLVLNRGVHEPLEEFCFQETLKKITEQKPVIIELGSYWAHYSMWFQKQFPEADCFMVEANSHNLEVGRSNFVANNFLNGQFFLSEVSNAGFNLDSFYEEQKIDRVTILHSDIQGWEIEMLNGAKSFLTRQVAQYIFLSTHSQKIHEEATKILKSYGYIIEVSSDFDHHSTSFDGFILATAPSADRVFENFQPFGRSEISTKSSDKTIEYLQSVNQVGSEKTGKIEIKFIDGRVSKIDEDVHELIMNLQNEINFEKKQFPFFWDLTKKIEDCDEILLDFYNYVLTHRKSSKSQLFQDLFVQFILNEKTNGTFLEFGATNGLELSNSFLLEKKFGWTGVLAEPSPQWHSQLFENRPNSNIITDCIYTETGKKLDFFVSNAGVLSTLEKFRNADMVSMPGNSIRRNASGYNFQVRSISLNDVISKYFNGRKIDYMSVDTEGSELLILKHFNFSDFAPKVVTVEHNFTDAEEELDELFFRNNYHRYFKGFTQFDAWYVRQD